MHVVFRVDASTDIGTGHVMRCLTLAHTLQNNHHKISFICRNLKGNLVQVINKSFHVTTLKNHQQSHHSEDNMHSHWLQTSWQQDADETIQSLNTLEKATWLVVDHYALDINWETYVKPYVSNILVIDDLADRKHQANLLLDQNYYPNMERRYEKLLPIDCKQLIGPKYVLLRDEFISAHDKIKERSNKINTILVFYGGADASNLTLRTLDAIKSIKTDLITHVIIGTMNPHEDIIRQTCKTMNSTHCYSNISNMAELMLEADLAICAGGTTTWERCYLGLPSIVLTLAHNQELVNKTIADLGACIHAGDISTSSDMISSEIKKLIDNPSALTDISKNALSLMSHHVGAYGILMEMENTEAHN